MRPVPHLRQGLGSPVLLVSGWQLGHEQLRQTLCPRRTYYPEKNPTVKKSFCATDHRRTGRVLKGQAVDLIASYSGVNMGSRQDVLADAETAIQVRLSLIPSLSQMALMPLIRFLEGCFTLIV